MSLHQRVAAFIECTPDVDALTLTVAMVEGIDDDEVFEAVHAVVTRALRNHVHAIELDNLRGAGPAILSHKLLAQTVAIDAKPNGLRLPIGRMTIDHHRQRIEMLTAKRDGLNVTIQFHCDAIALLEKTGAACLDKVPKGLRGAA